MQNELVRTSSLFGSPKNIIGNTKSDLILESLGKIYVKTGKQTKLLNDLFKLLDKTFEEPAEQVSSKVIITSDLKNLEYPYDGALVYDSKNKALYIAYQQRYLLILDNIDPSEDSIGYVKKKGDTMSGQLTIRHMGAPLVVASTELVENFNANYLEGHDSNYFAAKSLDEFIYGSWQFGENTSFKKDVIIDKNETIVKNLNVGGDGYVKQSLHSDGDLSTSQNLIVSENASVKGDIVLSGSIGSPAFMSGYNGYGWRFDANTNMLTVDYLVVRKAMQVFELVVNKISATNGSLWVTDSVEVDKVYPVRFIDVSIPNYQVYVDSNVYYVPYLEQPDLVEITSNHLANANGSHGRYDGNAWITETKQFVVPKYVCKLDQQLPEDLDSNIFKTLKTKNSEKSITDYLNVIPLFQSQIQNGVEEEHIPDVNDETIWYDEFPYNKIYIAEKENDKVLGVFSYEYKAVEDTIIKETYVNGFKYTLNSDKQYVYTQAIYNKFQQPDELNSDGTYIQPPFSFDDATWLDYLPEPKVSGQVYAKYADNTIEIVTSPADISGIKYTVQDYFQMEFFVPEEYNSSNWKDYNLVYNLEKTPTFLSTQMKEEFNIDDLQEIYLYYKYYGIEYNGGDFNPEMYIIHTKEDTQPTLKEGDLIRCQKFENNNIRYYDAVVMAQFDTYYYVIKVATSVFDKGTSVEYDENGKLKKYEEFTDRTMYDKTDQKVEINNQETLTETQYKELYGEDPIIASVQPKDGLVRIGNLWNPDRQNSVYITSSEFNSPYVRTLSQVNRPDYTVLWSTPDFKVYTKLFKLEGNEWVINSEQGQNKQCYYDTVQNSYVLTPNKNCEINTSSNGSYKSIFNLNVRAQFGNLEGIIDPMFKNKQPYGYGLFADNVFLKGEFYLNNGKTVVEFSKEQALIQSEKVVLKAVGKKDNLFYASTGDDYEDLPNPNILRNTNFDVPNSQGNMSYWESYLSNKIIERGYNNYNALDYTNCNGYILQTHIKESIQKGDVITVSFWVKGTTIEGAQWPYIGFVCNIPAKDVSNRTTNGKGFTDHDDRFDSSHYTNSNWTYCWTTFTFNPTEGSTQSYAANTVLFSIYNWGTNGQIAGIKVEKGYKATPYCKHYLDYVEGNPSGYAQDIGRWYPTQGTLQKSDYIASDGPNYIKGLPNSEGVLNLQTISNKKISLQKGQPVHVQLESLQDYNNLNLQLFYIKNGTAIYIKDTNNVNQSKNVLQGINQYIFTNFPESGDYFLGLHLQKASGVALPEIHFKSEIASENRIGTEASIKVENDSITQTVKDVSGNFTKLQQKVDGFDLRVTTSEGKISQIEQTANNISLAVGKQLLFTPSTSEQNLNDWKATGASFNNENNQNYFTFVPRTWGMYSKRSIVKVLLKSGSKVPVSFNYLNGNFAIFLSKSISYPGITYLDYIISDIAICNNGQLYKGTVSNVDNIPTINLSTNETGDFIPFGNEFTITKEVSEENYVYLWIIVPSKSQANFYNDVLTYNANGALLELAENKATLAVNSGVDALTGKLIETGININGDNRQITLKANNTTIEGSLVVDQDDTGEFGIKVQDQNGSKTPLLITGDTERETNVDQVLDLTDALYGLKFGYNENKELYTGTTVSGNILGRSITVSIPFDESLSFTCQDNENKYMAILGQFTIISVVSPVPAAENIEGLEQPFNFPETVTISITFDTYPVTTTVSTIFKRSASAGLLSGSYYCDLDSVHETDLLQNQQYKVKSISLKMDIGASYPNLNFSIFKNIAKRVVLKILNYPSSKYKTGNLYILNKYEKHEQTKKDFLGNDCRVSADIKNQYLSFDTNSFIVNMYNSGIKCTTEQTLVKVPKNSAEDDYWVPLSGFVQCKSYPSGTHILDDEDSTFLEIEDAAVILRVNDNNAIPRGRVFKIGGSTTYLKTAKLQFPKVTIVHGLDSTTEGDYKQYEFVNFVNNGNKGFDLIKLKNSWQVCPW